VSVKNKNLYYLEELSDYKVASEYSDVRGWDVIDALSSKTLYWVIFYSQIALKPTKYPFQQATLLHPSPFPLPGPSVSV
jgi:hypothetical protein